MTSNQHSDAQRIQAQEQLAVQLMYEFQRHYQAYRGINPQADQRVVFEAWVIQMLANILYELGDRTGVQPDKTLAEIVQGLEDLRPR